MTDPQTPREGWSAVNPFLQTRWSASSFEDVMLCPRRYEYSRIKGMSLKGRSVHTDFGGAFHGCLEVFDRARLAGDTKLCALDKAVEEGIRGTALWTDDPDEPAKSRRALLRAVVWYCDDQPETGGVQAYVLPDGTPAVELHFELPIGYTFGTGDGAVLHGYLDGLCQFGDEIFIRERKTTKKTVGGYYLASYQPSVQIDTYDLAGYLLFPTLKLSGVLLEANQTAVSFARFIRQPIYHTPRQREEWLQGIYETLKRVEEYAEAQHWPMNRAACNMYGGCPYRRICALDPTQRERVLMRGGMYEKRKESDRKVISE